MLLLMSLLYVEFYHERYKEPMNCVTHTEESSFYYTDEKNEVYKGDGISPVIEQESESINFNISC